jgi:hypothetical protein
MATNTCKSVVIYQDSEQYSIEPFLSERVAHAEKMFNEGKTDVYPNFVYDEVTRRPGQRTWVDHVAAQEWIDFVLLNAPTYNISIASAEIVDL